MTTTATRSPPLPGLEAVAGFYRVTVEKYHEMIRNNTLTTDDHIELLDGYLVNKMPQNTPHGSTVQRLNKRLLQIVPGGWEVRCQLPFTTPESEPEPDFAVVRGNDRSFDSHHPGAADFGIVIEVSDSSLALDRRLKLHLYARAGIPIYWIINIPERLIEVYTNPDSNANPPIYLARVDYAITDGVPIVLDGVTVATLPVADIIA